MVKPVEMQYSQTFPAPPAEAFDKVLPLPLPELFDRRYGPIPAIRSVDGPASPWGETGQARTLHLKGGGSLREELTRVDRPGVFGYTITDVKGPMKALASRIDGSWSFDADGAGTRVTWRWTMYPRSSGMAPIVRAFARIWRGYARQSFQRLEGFLAA
jgi:Polyketide cyclase / dehydrase and lipid transport